MPMRAVALVLLLLAHTDYGRRLKLLGVQANRIRSIKSHKPGDKAASNNFYERLGVAKDATDEDIKKNYKKAAFKWHPDKNLDNKENAEKMFHNVAEAYESLSDPRKRKVYDLGGAEAVRGSHSGGSGGAPHHYGGHASGRQRGNPFGGGGMSGGAPHYYGGNAGHQYGNPFGGMSKEHFDSMFFGQMPGNAGPQFSAGQETSGNGYHSQFFPAGNHFGSSFSPGQEMFHEMSGNAFGSQFYQGRQQRHQEPHYVLPQDTMVVLRSIVSRPQLNGKVGRVLSFDPERRKYAVEVQNAHVYVKRQNLVGLGGSVRIVDLKSKPQFNGKSATVNNFQLTDERYMVRVDQSESVLGIRRVNCLLQPGTRVVLEGLSNPKFNGEGAQIIGIEESSERYVVKGEDERVISVKYENVMC